MRIPPSEGTLPDDAPIEDYRLFAGLASPCRDHRTAARERLPAILRDVPGHILLRLAIQIGGGCRECPVRSTSMFSVLKLDPATLAAVVANGASLLTSWPHGIRTWVDTRADALRDDRDSFVALRKRICRIMSRGERPEQVALVEAVFPDLKKHQAHSFPGDRRYYLTQAVCAKLGVNSPQLAKLRAWSGLRFTRQPGEGRMRNGQFDADQIDELERAFRGGVPVTRASEALDLPNYAVEQLCDASLLKREDHPAVLAVRHWPTIRAESLRSLQSDLVSSAQTTVVPFGAVTLRRAASRIGGRPKPWACILGDAADARLEYWLSDANATTRTMLVLPESIATYQNVAAPRPETIAPMSKEDACEALNAKADFLPFLENGHGLRFVKSGKALRAPAADVLRVASEIAFASEISWHTRFAKLNMEQRLLDLGIARVGQGWPRNTLVAAGVLPSIAMPI